MKIVEKNLVADKVEVRIFGCRIFSYNRRPTFEERVAAAVMDQNQQIQALIESKDSEMRRSVSEAFSKVQASIHDVQASIHDVHGQVHDSYKDVRQIFDAKFSLASESCKELQAKMDVLRNDIESLVRTECGSVRENDKAMQAKMDVLRNDIESLVRTECGSVRENDKAMQAKMDVLRNDIESLVRTECGSVRENDKAMQAKTDALQGELSKVHAEVRRQTGQISDYKIIANSKYFDCAWYGKKYLANCKEEVDPVLHYLEIGWKEGNAPSRLFNGEDYLNANADVRRAKVNPLLHYVRHGIKEGRALFVVNKDKEFVGGNSPISDGNINGDDFETIKTSIARPSADVVSFDIFDTLLIRPFARPTDLFALMEKCCDRPGFAPARVTAERRARNKHKELKEINFNEIYDEILPEYKSLKKIELDFEKMLLRQHPGNYELYLEGVRSGKKIIAVSDMYLPKDFLMEVLRKNGYTEIDEVFVSCEYRKTKHLGGLFEEVKARYSGMRILHIGDNRVSDVEGARQAGLQAMLVAKYTDGFLKDERFAKFNKSYSSNPSLEKSLMIGLSAYRFAFNRTNNEYYYNLGYTLGGPLALGYVQFIHRKVKANGVDSLAFIARDGYVLKQAYEWLYGDEVETRYVYATRTLGLKCFLDYKGNKDYLCAMLRMLGVDIPDGATLDAMKELLEKNRAEIEKKSDEYRLEYEKYFAGLKMKGRNVASVDMTTGAFTSEDICTRMLGERYGFGIFSATFKHTDTFGYYTYSPRLWSSKNLKAAVLTELLISAPELPITGIKDGMPVYAESTNEDELRKYASDCICEGVMDFVKDYKKWIGGCGSDFRWDEVFDILENFCGDLSDVDATELGKIKHAGDANNSEFVSILELLRH